MVQSNQVLHAYAGENQFVIAEANTDLDHIHLLIQAPPTVYLKRHERLFCQTAV